LTFWPFSNWVARSMAMVEINGRKYLYSNSYSGIVYRENYANSDDGSSINRRYDTKKFSMEKLGIQKKHSILEIAMKAVGSYNLSVSQRVDWDTSFSTAENVSMRSADWVLGENLPATLGGAEAVQATYELCRTANLIQFRFQNNTTNPPFQLYGAELYAKNLAAVRDDR